jgi:hypothetical protein
MLMGKMMFSLVACASRRSPVDTGPWKSHLHPWSLILFYVYSWMSFMKNTKNCIKYSVNIWNACETVQIFLFITKKNFALQKFKEKNLLLQCIKTSTLLIQNLRQESHYTVPLKMWFYLTSAAVLLSGMVSRLLDCLMSSCLVWTARKNHSVSNFTDFLTALGHCWLLLVVYTVQ